LKPFSRHLQIYLDLLSVYRMADARPSDKHPELL
jgi:hypothetical protein